MTTQLGLLESCTRLDAPSGERYAILKIAPRLPYDEGSALAAQKTLVCFGDSLTEGAIGASYVDLLRVRLPLAVRVINAGINGDTTLNLLRRVERDVVSHR